MQARVEAQEHGPAAEVDLDLVGGPGVAGLGVLPAAAAGYGDVREQAQGDRGEGDGVELGPELGQALAGGGQGGREALVLGGQAHGLRPGLTQLVAGKAR